MPKEWFDQEAIDEWNTMESTVVDLVSEGTQTYLSGLYSRREIHKRQIANVAAVRGEKVIRATGKLIGKTFDITPYAAARVTDQVVGYTDPNEKMNGLSSFIAGRMVEGLTDAGCWKLAAGLFDLRVVHPEIRDEVLQYLLIKDPNIKGK